MAMNKDDCMQGSVPRVPGAGCDEACERWVHVFRAWQACVAQAPWQVAGVLQSSRQATPPAPSLLSLSGTLEVTAHTHTLCYFIYLSFIQGYFFH